MRVVNFSTMCHIFVISLGHRGHSLLKRQKIKTQREVPRQHGNHFTSPLDEILQKYYLEVRKQDGTDYETDSLKVMQAALERCLSDK